MILPATPTRIWDYLCRYRHWLLGGFAALAAADVAWVALTYIVYPGYLDHGEPSVTLISWRLLEGVPAYPAFDDPGSVANIYGPLTYMVHALAFAGFGPSPAVGKLAAVAAAITIPAAVFMGQRRRGMEAALIGLVIAAALVLLHVPTSIWNRPDSFLALLVAVAVWAANAAAPGRAEWPKSILIAVCGGLAVGLKIHGGIYVAPVAVCHCLNPHRGLRTFAAMCVAGGLVAALPFALPWFSAANYAAWLGLAAGKASPLDHLLKMLRYGIIYMVPLGMFVAAWMRAKKSAGKRDAAVVSSREIGYAAVYALSLVAAIYLGGKPGAGIHYFYPLLAVNVDLTLRFVPQAGGRPQIRAAALAAFAVVVLAVSVPVQKRHHHALHWQQVAAVQAEIRTIMAENPGRTIEMGVGQDVASYPRTYYKTILVLAGNPYTLDVGVNIEWSKRGIPLPDATLAMIRGCNTELWLIPKGERPFAMVGYYGNPIFEPAFIDAFHGSYAKVKSFEFFDIWACKR